VGLGLLPLAAVSSEPRWEERLNPDHILYRAIRRPEARIQDFRSDAEKGKPALPLQVRDPRLYTGVSAFEPLAWAAQRARELHLGGYLAEMHVPRSIAIDKTLGRGHCTVQGTAKQRF